MEETEPVKSEKPEVENNGEKDEIDQVEKQVEGENWRGVTDNSIELWHFWDGNDLCLESTTIK